MPRTLQSLFKNLRSPVMSENFAYRLWRLASYLRLNIGNLRNQQGSLETVDLKGLPDIDYYTRFGTTIDPLREYVLSIMRHEQVLFTEESWKRSLIYTVAVFNIITSMPWQVQLWVMGNWLNGAFAHKWLSCFWCQRSANLSAVYSPIEALLRCVRSKRQLDWRHGATNCGISGETNDWDRTHHTKFRETSSQANVRKLNVSARAEWSPDFYRWRTCNNHETILIGEVRRARSASTSVAGEAGNAGLE